MITSRNNSKLKRVRKLLASARERRETGLFVAEGVRLVSEIPPELLEEVLVSGSAPAGISPDEGRTEVVEPTLFQQLSDTVHPQGILAVVRKPCWKESEALDKKTGKILLLDGVRDPGNLGTMIRTAEAAGVRAVYMSPDCVDLFNPKVIRSTMGSIFRVPVFSAPLPEVIQKLQQRGIRVYATALSAVKSFRDADLEQAGIVIGSEANGISREVAGCVQECIKIPMAGQVESLNAAVSAAILMFA